ncbi:MAG: hypothetical protein HWN81_21620, partial [Candidatus Lokiarchaeota archaeon]|nr:hypothetical protein [Candidatus Lokiarchaeota archaeon]
YEKTNKDIKKLNNRIEKTVTQKEIKSIEREIKKFLKNINDIIKEKDKAKGNLNNLFKDVKDGLIELKKFKNRTDFEDLVNKVQLSKVKPVDLTKEQFNSLFLSFKSIKYMAPPTDTAIPVGESILENTLIKEIGLRISDNLDDFDMPIDTIKKITDLLYDEKKRILLEEKKETHDEAIANIKIDSEELINLSSEILGTIDIVDGTSDSQQGKQTIIDLLTFSDIDSIESYRDVFDFFLETYTKDDDFVAGETRSPTSGKGLAYVVEAVMAYSRNIEVPKRARDVLSRFVNRTPKLRDSADCAITKAVQSVKWKNYNLESYDNGLPRGPIKLLVNVSGPFVHLMFKSQSKNALADDEELIKEIKFCLEAIGRRLRVYLNRRASLHKSEKRSSLIEKYIPIFAKSVYNIASRGESKYKAKVAIKEIEDLMKGAIGKKPVPVIVQDLISKIPEPKEIEIIKEEQKEEELLKEEIHIKKEIIIKKPEPKKEMISKKTLLNWTVKELKDYCKEQNIEIQSKTRKTEIIEKILVSFTTERVIKKPEKIEPIVSEIITEKPMPLIQSVKKTPKPTTTRAAPSKSTQMTLPIITKDRIISVLSNEWQTIKHLIFKLKIKDMMDARYLQLKLKELERKGDLLVEIKMGRKHWKLK